MKSRMLARASLIFFLTLGVIIDGPFARATNAISLISSASTVGPNSTVDLTAAMPVVAAGSTTQTLTQVIDPTKVKLTSASDITFPAGWTLTYSTDGTTFSSTAPTITSGWAAVRAVRASGPINSSGSDGNGNQIAIGTATGSALNLAPAAIATSGVAGTDGYQAFFDVKRTRVFNLFHHSVGATLDCHVISTGETCVGFPYDYGGSTSEAAAGVVVGNTIWAASEQGFFCIDITSVLANANNVIGQGSPSKCYGSTARVPGIASNWPLVAFTGASELGQASETKLYALRADAASGAVVYCVDTESRSLCATPALNTMISKGSATTNDVQLIGENLYVFVSTDTGQNLINCINVATGNRCVGWSSNYLSESTGAYWNQAGKFAQIPNAQGALRGICFLRNEVNISWTDQLWGNQPCWNLDGTTFTVGSINLPRLATGIFRTYGNPVELGSRLYLSNGNTSTNSGEILCYDAATNNGSGGRCNGALSNSSFVPSALAENYTVTPDPLIQDCVWVTRHTNPVMRTFNIKTGVAGCTALAQTTASFSGSAIVPRMACNSNQDAIRQWDSFTLKTAGTGTFTSATLTVKNSSGVAISGWTDRSVSLNTPLDLSALSPGSTGLTPTFEVAFGGITGSITTASAEVKVVGDAPELCTRVTAVYACPSGSGPIASLANSTATVSASGSSVFGGVTTTLPQVDQGITITAPALSSCTSSITGRAGDGGGGSSGSAISGVTVSLLDSSGNPVLVNGSPVTTTTASDGTYSFANVLPASYKIRFNEPGTQVLTSSTVVSGASGTTTGTSTVLSAATSATSNVAATIAGTNAVVNALYTIPAAAAADTPAAGTQGSAQTINVLSNDNAASGATLTASTVRFCGLSPAQSPPSCSQTTLTTADGSYSVNTSTGVVTFTPNASFTGTATQPPTYQVTDSASNVVSATITPSIIARPALTADTSSGAWDQNQTISPLANDTAGNGASLVANSVKLCASGDTAPNCTATSRTIAGQGTYTVNSDGTITFDPLPSFTGTASPVTYSVTDSLGQKSSTTITPSVSAPGAPVANPQSKLVSPTATTAFTTITGTNGLATGTQLSPSQTFLCNVAPNAQTPPNCNATTVTTTDGTWVLSQITGVATYQPNAGTPSGTKTAITYQVTDPAGQSAFALLTPVIPPAPSANPDSSSGQQAVAQVISLIGNDQPGMASSPIDFSSVKFCVGNQVAPNCSATSLTVSGQGTYSIDSLGIVTFTPIASFTGTATPITYQVSDSIGQSASSTLSVYVIPPPAPVATRDLGSAAYGQAVVFEPWTNDSGGAKPAGATQADPQVVPTSIRLCASGQSAPNCAATTITTIDGSYNLDTTTGKVTFTPASGFSGTATAPITYQISNNWTGPSGPATTTAILIPTIAAPGDPLATNDQSSTKPETPVTLKPITNDTAGSFALNAASLRLCDATDIAPNCSHLSVTNAHGTYVVDPSTGAVTFTPAKGFKGLATIPYVLSDMNTRFANANLFITVNSDAATKATKTNEKVLAKTGSNGAYALGAIAIISAFGGTAVIASSQRKQSRS